jgi:hypothetical protein
MGPVLVQVTAALRQEWCAFPDLPPALHKDTQLLCQLGAQLLLDSTC